MAIATLGEPRREGWEGGGEHAFRPVLDSQGFCEERRVPEAVAMAVTEGEGVTSSDGHADVVAGDWPRGGGDVGEVRHLRRRRRRWWWW